MSALDVKQGDNLDFLAEHIYGVKRKPGEPDADLRKRCDEKLNRYFFAKTGRTSAKPAPANNGATCTHCKEHNPYAEAVGAYVCYRCR